MLSADDQAGLEEIAVRDEIPAGDKIIRQRSRAHSVLILLRGWAAVASEPAAHEGERESGVLLAFRGDGDIVGEMAAITGAPRSATVRALDEVDVLEISITEFRTYMEAHPDAHWVLDQVLVSRLTEAPELVRLERDKIPTKVAWILVELAKRVGRRTREGLWLTHPQTQAELAGLIQVSRESVNSALMGLRAEGLVTLSKNRRLIITDLEGLRKMVAEAHNL